jgi:hypothetical protein
VSVCRTRSRRYGDQFWKSLLKGDNRRSKEENIKKWASRKLSFIEEMDLL